MYLDVSINKVPTWTLVDCCGDGRFNKVSDTNRIQYAKGFIIAAVNVSKTREIAWGMHDEASKQIATLIDDTGKKPSMYFINL